MVTPHICLLLVRMQLLEDVGSLLIILIPESHCFPLRWTDFPSLQLCLVDLRNRCVIRVLTAQYGLLLMNKELLRRSPLWVDQRSFPVMLVLTNQHAYLNAPLAVQG